MHKKALLVFVCVTGYNNRHLETLENPETCT